ncbi:MAG: hypothetical protein H8E51_07030 [Bacteroidetes bacterium]|nr:hypothetical protein [Bacteroidota bacterium]
MKKAIIGIDPGVSGGIAIWKEEIVEAINMPKTITDIFNVFTSTSLSGYLIYVFIEKVHSMPKQGVASSFKFGQAFGRLEAFTVAMRFRTQYVTPQAWTRWYSLGTRGKMSPAMWKNKLKEKAQQLYPDSNVTRENADSVLIMHYGLRQIKESEGIEL